MCVYYEQLTDIIYAACGAHKSKNQLLLLYPLVFSDTECPRRIRTVWEI